MAGREMEVGLLASQVISNVPGGADAFRLYPNATALLGVDVGGLGTLVASLASLIAFKLYMQAPGAKGGRFMKAFTLMNVLFSGALFSVQSHLSIPSFPR